MTLCVFEGHGIMRELNNYSQAEYINLKEAEVVVKSHYVEVKTFPLSPPPLRQHPLLLLGISPLFLRHIPSHSSHQYTGFSTSYCVALGSPILPVMM
jgi:hypothetical protein